MTTRSNKYYTPKINRKISMLEIYRQAKKGDVIWREQLDRNCQADASHTNRKIKTMRYFAVNLTTRQTTELTKVIFLDSNKTEKQDRNKKLLTKKTVKGGSKWKQA